MAFSNPFRSSEERIVVDAGSSVEAVASKRSALALLQLVAVLLVLLTSVVLLMMTGSQISEKESVIAAFYQAQEEKRLQVQTQESLQALVNRLDDIRQESDDFAQSLPLDPRYGQVLSWLEKRFEDLKAVGFVQLPEAVSWRVLKASEIADPDLQNVGVVEYSVPFYGEYEAFVQLLEALQTSRRLLDVVAMRNLKLDEEGLVSADVSLWAYHVPNL